MVLRVKRSGWGKPFLYFVFVLAVCISAVSLSFKYYSDDFSHLRIVEMEKSLTDIKAAIELEKVRINRVQQILKIVKIWPH